MGTAAFLEVDFNLLGDLASVQVVGSVTSSVDIGVGCFPRGSILHLYPSHSRQTESLAGPPNVFT